MRTAALVVLCSASSSLLMASADDGAALLAWAKELDILFMRLNETGYGNEATICEYAEYFLYVISI